MLTFPRLRKLLQGFCQNVSYRGMISDPPQIESRGANGEELRDLWVLLIAIDHVSMPEFFEGFREL